MDVGVEIQAFEPLFSTGEIAVLLAAVTLYGVLSMANFAILGVTVSRRTTPAFRACGALAGVNYLAGLAAGPVFGCAVGLPMVAEVAGLMYLQLAILALIVSRQGPEPEPEPEPIPRAFVRL